MVDSSTANQEGQYTIISSVALFIIVGLQILQIITQLLIKVFKTKTTPLSSEQTVKELLESTANEISEIKTEVAAVDISQQPSDLNTTLRSINTFLSRLSEMQKAPKN